MEPMDPNADPDVLEALHAPEDPVGETAEEGDGESAKVDDEDGEED